MSQTEPKSKLVRRIGKVIAAIAALYFVLAYIILPAAWSHYEHQPGLATLPMVTRTAQGIPGDPLNVGLVGSKEEVIGAMLAAGWHAADAITRESSIKIGLSVVFDKPYPDAPVSNLYFDRRSQDLAFERAVGESADRRHHVRFWMVLSKGAEGREVWLGSASFDKGVGLSHDTGQITHHIAPDLDAERDYIIETLTAIGALKETYQVTGIGPTLNGHNGGGDPYFTDGEITIGVIDASRTFDKAAPATPRAPVVLANPPAVAAKNRLWGAIVSAGRFLHLIPERGDGRAT